MQARLTSFCFDVNSGRFIFVCPHCDCGRDFSDVVDAFNSLLTWDYCPFCGERLP